MVTDVRPEHLENANSPMLVTELGIVTEVRLKHLENASFPMLITELPILTDVSPEHSLYLQPVITQYFASNKSEIWS